MKNSLLLICFFALCAIVSQAQEVQINEDPAVSSLFQDWTNNNRTNPGIDGWRLQLMASADRQQVEQEELRFKTIYPDVPAAWVHEKPYYKLRVGAFRTRFEAQAFIPAIGDEFPGAYPAKDPAIHPRDFLRF